MQAARVSALVALTFLPACHGHRRFAPDAGGASALVRRTVEADVDLTAAPSDELVPGPLNAFGLPLPSASRERFGNADTKMFTVEAAMPRVMRYLERRLEMRYADIHPLAAVIHGAVVKEARTGLVIDVGVRDEGERTLVTIWNRTPPTQALGSEVTPEQGLRAAGIDPSTGRPLPSQNH